MKKKPKVLLKKDRVDYAEKFVSPGCKIKGAFLPKLPHATGYVAVEAYLLEAGAVTRPDGREQEYHLLKVYLEPKK